MKPRLGFFGFSKDINAISAAGYDSIEMHMHEIMKLEDLEFTKTCQSLQELSLGCEVLDNPVPLDKCIADESFDLGFYREYLKKGADRAARMGVKYYVFGNGKTRCLPASGDIEAAREKNLAFMRMLSDITADRGITVLLEPLAPRVSNVMLSIPEVLDYIKLVGKSNMGTLLDYRWFLSQQHPFQMIEEFGTVISHVHLDNPITEFPQRVIPRMADDHDYSLFFKALEKINYSGIISLEVNTFTNFEQDLQDGLAFFKSFGLAPLRAKHSG